jgi:hypothetical protein
VVLGAMLVAWVPIELAMAWFLRNKKELACNSRGRRAPGP